MPLVMPLVIPKSALRTITRFSKGVVFSDHRMSNLCREFRRVLGRGVGRSQMRSFFWEGVSSMRGHLKVVPSPPQHS